jgi:hypothetical protein
MFCLFLLSNDNTYNIAIRFGEREHFLLSTKTLPGNYTLLKTEYSLLPPPSLNNHMLPTSKSEAYSKPMDSLNKRVYHS